MSLFGGDWIEDYDSLKVYEDTIEHFNDEYDKQSETSIGSTIHGNDSFNPLEEYEKGIQHFD